MGIPTDRRRRNSRKRTFELLYDVEGIKTVMQVGIGDWAEGPALISLYNDVSFIGIEPIHRYREEAIRKGFPGIIFPGVCWSESGIDFTFADQRTESNLFEKDIPRWDNISAKSITLDEICIGCRERGLWKPPVLLWMDCEGSELEVLKGGREALKDISHMIVELKDRPKRPNVQTPGHKLIYELGEIGFFLRRRQEDGLFVKR